MVTYNGSDKGKLVAFQPNLQLLMATACSRHPTGTKAIEE